jgi:DNA-binding NarL/FixJ family response regulator
MATRVLLADDSVVMRTPILRLLKEETSVELVGQASGFGETLRLSAALKPDILLMDIHANYENQCAPSLVGEQLRRSVKCILAISVWNDEKAHVLAARLGANVLLDKASLYSTLIPAIKHHRASIPSQSVQSFATSSPTVEATSA